MKVVLENLTKIFPSRNKKAGKEVVAVNNFSFEIPDGKLVGLLGPSGCGKSTTLYMICGLQKPSGGHIYFGDDDVTGLEPENRGVGLVFQNYALYPHMTVKQNILFPLQNFKGADKLSKEDMLKRAYNVAKLVQIDELMERKPSELSGGQQQRVAIARALVKMPRVLLLDEPLSNLDARLRLQTREEIRRIQRETKITTVFVTHDQEEAMSISDFIVVMKLGVVQQIGKPQDVYDSPANLFVAKFLGTPPINVFNGRIHDGKVYIGEDAVIDAEGVEDQDVYIGIRPEGFILDENGPLHCKLSSVEVMGRDVSIVSTNDNAATPMIRSIIPADSNIDKDSEIVRFSIKPHKIFVFAKEEIDWSVADDGVCYNFDGITHEVTLPIGGKRYEIGALAKHDEKEVAKLGDVADEVEDENNDDIPVERNRIQKWFDGIKDNIVEKVDAVKMKFFKPMEIEEDVAYDLVVGHTASGKTLYFSGEVKGTALGATANLLKAKQVFVEKVAVEPEVEPIEEVEDGKKKAKKVVNASSECKLYFMDGDVKKYINLEVVNGENHEKRIYLNGDQPLVYDYDAESEEEVENVEQVENVEDVEEPQVETQEQPENQEEPETVEEV